MALGLGKTDQATQTCLNSQQISAASLTQQKKEYPVSVVISTTKCKKNRNVLVLDTL
jgi:hypothetical protein